MGDGKQTSRTLQGILILIAAVTAFASDFDALVGAGTIARYEVTPRTVVVYLTSLQPTRVLTLQYSMRATMPVVAQSAAPTAYQYYNPERKARGLAASIRPC